MFILCYCVESEKKKNLHNILILYLKNSIACYFIKIYLCLVEYTAKEHERLALNTLSFQRPVPYDVFVLSFTSDVEILCKALEFTFAMIY